MFWENNFSINIKNLEILFAAFFIISSCNSFNSEKWKSANWQSENSSRQGQASSTINSKILLGKSYDEVLSLLSKEDFKMPIQDTISSNPDFEIQYILGGCGMIDYERLSVQFESGKVSKVEKKCD